MLETKLNEVFSLSIYNSTFDNIPHKQDTVPESVYTSAKNLIITTLKYFGASDEWAEEKASKMIKDARTAAFSTIDVDGSKVVAKTIFVEVERLNESKVNIVTVNEVKYEHHVVNAILVLVSKSDAYLVKYSFDYYESVEGNEEFSENQKYQRISTEDVQSLVSPLFSK